MVDRCVCCGAEVPEGQMVCWGCANSVETMDRPPEGRQTTDDADLCRSCVYRSDLMYVNRCDYLLITGHSRGCPGDANCKRYRKGPRKRMVAAKPIRPARRQEKGDVEYASYIYDNALKTSHQYSLERSLRRNKRD